MTSPYKPVSFGSEQLDLHKLQQMANNEQWLFENTSRIRYATNGLVRDSGLKIIAGKTPYPHQTTRNFVYQNIYFGSYFSAGCRPVVVATMEGTGGSHHRAHHVIQGLSGELDHRGFICIVATEAVKVLYPGWIHWIAVGY